MCNWRAWLLPGILTLIIITALAVLVRGGPIEADLTARSGDTYASDGVPWASATLDGRDVTLTGVAPTEAAQAAAIASANRVPGVYVVDSSGLTLLEIADPYALSFTKAADSIMVDGSFPNGEARAAVLDDVRAVAGDLEVIDQTSLARGAPADFDAFVDYALASVPALSNGTIALTGSDLSVEGDAPTIDGYNAELARLASPVEGLTVGSIDIAPPITSPYTWGAEAMASGVTLTGFVPDEDARAAIVSAASSLGTVDDQMEIGFGAPEGFAGAATALLGQLGGLNNGSASITDLDLAISGEAPDSNSYLAANGFLGTLPEGFNSLSGRIDAPLAEPFVTMLVKADDAYTLSGVLPDETTRALILDALSGQTVVDTATIARGAPAGVNISDVFASTAATFGDLVEGQATLSDADFNVSGLAASYGDADTATASLEGLASANLNVDASIERGPVSPFTFAAAADDAAITLDGFVPSQESRDSILSEVAATFPTLNVNDNLVIADGAPDGFNTLVESALRRIGRLEGARMTLRDRFVNISGLALHQRASEDFADTASFTVPDGFEIETDVALAPPPVRVNGTRCQIILANLMGQNTIRFDTGSAAIDSVSFGLLDRLARTLQSCPASRVEVGGHTDSQGSDTGNQALSESRASAVRDYMVDAGIAGDRLIAVGFGEANPIADNDTEEGRARNRRIAFVVLPDVEPEPEPAPEPETNAEGDEASSSTSTDQ